MFILPSVRGNVIKLILDSVCTFGYSSYTQDKKEKIMPRKKKTVDVPVVETPKKVQDESELRAEQERELVESLEKKAGPPTTARAHLTKEAERILSGLGITHAEMAREASEELMTPKMALVGCLQTIQRICEISTNNIMNSVGPLNVSNLAALFAGLRGTLGLAERVTMNYTRAQAALRAKELMDAIQKKIRDVEAGEVRASEAPGTGSDFTVDPTDDDLAQFDRETQDESPVTIGIGVSDDDDDGDDDPRFGRLFEVNRTKKPKILN